MRILLIGPDHASGSLSPYLRLLAAALRAKGATVNRLSSPALPYDTQAHRFWSIEQTLDTAAALLDQVDLSAYDLLSVHFGNLELEQLLPVLWAERQRARTVYHVHTLTPTLLSDHIPAETLHRAVLQGIRSMDGLVYFGRYAQRLLADQHQGIPGRVAWWPATIPAGTRPHLPADLADAVNRSGDVPLVSLYGFASPWKSVETLIQACQRLTRPARIVVAGPFWDDPPQAGVPLKTGITQLNDHVDLAVVPSYLQPGARLALLRASTLGVFPYQDHPSFQGSGAIGDYLAEGVPVIAGDVANMAEVVGSGGLAPPEDPSALFHTLDEVLGHDRTLATLRATAQGRAARFTMEEHARRCLAFYRTISARLPAGANP